jgi:hypothetical protein
VVAVVATSAAVAFADRLCAVGTMISAEPKLSGTASPVHTAEMCPRSMSFHFGPDQPNWTAARDLRRLGGDWTVRNRLAGHWLPRLASLIHFRTARMAPIELPVMTSPVSGADRVASHQDAAQGRRSLDLRAKVASDTTSLGFSRGHRRGHPRSASC